MKRLLKTVLGYSACLTALAVIVAPAQPHALESGQRPAGLDPDKRLTQYVFDSWSRDDGLRTTRILDVAQTTDGYLWVATLNGLARFDGVRFSIFDPINTSAFTSSEITALEPRADGGLWIGSRDGTIVLRSGATFTRMIAAGPERSHGIFSLHEDQAGHLWVSGEQNALHRYAYIDQELRPLPPTSSMKNVSVPKPLVVRDAFYEGEDGTLWFASQGNGVYAIREDTLRVFTTAEGLNNDFVQAIAGDRNGSIWIASRGLNVLRDGRIEDVTEALGLHGTPIPSLHVDRFGSLWIGEQRLFRHGRGGTERFEALKEFYDPTFFEDMDGSLWAGSVVGPLVRFKNGFMTTISVEEGLSGGLVHSVHADRAGNVWVGTSRAGLNRISVDGIEHYTEADGLPSDRVWSIQESSRHDGRIWIGTDRGLVRYERGRFDLIDTADGLASNRVWIVYPDPDGSGTLWIGTIDAGLNRWSDGEVSHWDIEDGLAHEQVRWLLKDRAGALWIGTARGLNLLRNDELITVDAPPAVTRTRCAYEDSDGTLWIGSSGGGFARYHEGRFTVYDTSDGLPTNDVWAILEDERANLWMSTTEGILRIAKDDIAMYDAGAAKILRVRNYGTRDGMKSAGGTSGGFPSAWKGSDGRFWFATVQGVVTFSPDQEPDSGVPKAIIESISFDGESVAPVGEFAIPAGTRLVALRYTAPSLVAGPRLCFQYRLVGYDNEWTDNGSDRIARFTKLPPGRYHFEVVTYDPEGGGSAEPTAMSFRVLPLWWQTTWFRGSSAGAILVLVGSAVFLITRSRENRRQSVQQRHDELAQLGRLATIGELASTIGHELRQPLGAIRTNAEAARRFLRTESPDVGEVEVIVDDIVRDTERATEVMNRVRTSARKRSLRPERLDPNEVIRSVLQLIRSLAERNKVILSFRADQDLPMVTGDQIQLEQVLLNLILNSIDAMHDASMRRLELSGTAVDGDFVQISVRDTGMGAQGRNLDRLFQSFYTTKSTGTGLGLAISSSIVEAHGGTIWAEENPDRGLTFSFTIPSASPSNGKQRSEVSE